LSITRMTTFSPCWPARVLTRRSIGLPAHKDVYAAVLGQPAFGDVQAGHDLDAAGDGGQHLERRAELFIQRPVHAVADTKGVVVRLDVDIGCAFLDGIEDEVVHQFDDRGAFGGGLQVGDVLDLLLDE